MSQVLSLSRREPLSDFKGIAKTLSEQSDGGRLWWRRKTLDGRRAVLQCQSGCNHEPGT